jgi:hypothetical protein
MNQRPARIAGAILLLAALVRIPTLGQPLIEHHSFRQTQTAFTAVVFAEDGIDLFHSKLPVFGPPFEVPFEFPLFQALDAVLIMAGLPADFASRLLGLATFLLAGWLLWLLARRLASERVALIALFAYTVSPLSVMFGRASLIDWLALSGSLAFVYGAVRWIDERRLRWLVLAILAGVIGTTVKLPTFIAFPFLVLAYQLQKHGLRRTLSPASWLHMAVLAVIVIVPLAAGIGWTAWADAIKAATPITVPQTSSSLAWWNFGTMAQRLDIENWKSVVAVHGGLVVGLGWVPALLFVLPRLRRPEGRWLVLGYLALAAVPVLLFFNLYFIHDYYAIAVTTGWAMLVALGVDELWRHVGRRAIPLMGIAAAVSLAATGLYWSIVYTNQNLGEGPDYLERGAELARHTSPDDLVVVAGYDWMPSVQYFARRWGLSIPGYMSDDVIADQLGLYKVMITRNTEQSSIRYLRIWPWYAPIDKNSYRLGLAEADLPAEAAHWSLEQDVAVGELLQGPTELQCGSPYDPPTEMLPTSPAGIVVQLSPENDVSGRVRVDPALAPVQPRGTLVFPAGYAGVPALTCSDQETIVIDGIYAAAP